VTLLHHNRLVRLDGFPDRTIVALAAAAALAPVLLALALGANTGDETHVTIIIFAVVLSYSAIATLAALAALIAGRNSGGAGASTWYLFSWGLLAWALGGLTYLTFLATGGDFANPAAWSQIGYLLAYPFWYVALWRLRQPVLAPSRRSQIETLAVEAGALLMLGAVVGSILWHPDLPASENIAQLVPALLDLLLLAAFYGAVRRSRWTGLTALSWIGYAFLVLAATDQLVTYFVTREHHFLALAAAMGYIGAMALMAIAAGRPLRVVEARSSVRPTTIAVIGLSAAGVASVVAPPDLRPVIWAVGVLLAWRTLVLVGDQEIVDTDVLTGFLDRRAFERHLGGVIQSSSPDRRSLLIGVDMSGFGAWNARNGYSAGDALIERVSQAVESAGPEAASWGRLGPDRFALTAPVSNDRGDRALCELLRSEAALAAGELDARAGLVVVPDDSSSSAEALAALDEALSAAGESSQNVVAYARGELDGLMTTPRSASLSQRRERIQETIASPEAIRCVLQPIVGLDDRRIRGFEALSRFTGEPRRGPDKWIAEATQVGLGVDLEIECLRRGGTRLGELPDGTYLSLNASPDAILSDAMLEMLGDRPLDRVVIEITEHEQVSNYPRLASRLAALRGRGARTAIDDTGAGHASLNHLIELRPDYIKLDRAFVRGLDSDAGKKALVRNMLRLARDLGAELIAEGIETEAELAALNDLDVPLGQGYLLGRPAAHIDERVERLGVAEAPDEELRRPRMTI
jgi:predicted signal transduction protein with EAL and GGDEF domain